MQMNKVFAFRCCMQTIAVYVILCVVRRVRYRHVPTGWQLKTCLFTVDNLHREQVHSWRLMSLLIDKKKSQMMLINNNYNNDLL